MPINGLFDILKSDINTILIGTTSTINIMNHLILMDGEFIHDEYDFVSFPFSGINGWQLSSNEAPKKIFSNF